MRYLGKVEPNSEELDILKSEFNEKKIQKIIRSGLKFEPFKCDYNFLLNADKLKIRFFRNISHLSYVGKEQLINRFKTGYTYHSCSIEGNTLSRAQVDLVINRNQSIDGKKLLEIAEVRGHKKAIDYMMSELGDLSEEFIKRLHEVLMEGTMEFIEK